MHNLSDEALCARWLENAYYQFFKVVSGRFSKER
jgi:hypothetical protein